MKYLDDKIPLERREEKIIRQGTMPDGTEMRLEEGGRIVAYPKSKANYHGVGEGYPVFGEPFCASFRFETCEHAAFVFDRLEQGSVTLSHYAKAMECPQYADCL